MADREAEQACAVAVAPRLASWVAGSDPDPVGEQLTADERTALQRITCPTATHWITRALGWPKDHGKTRRMLHRLAARNLVHPVESKGRTFWWAPTVSGEAALAKAGASQ